MATFEDRLQSLEAVVERLERGELTLDESVRLYEEGVTLSNACKQELERTEGRIQVLVEGPGGGLEPAEFAANDVGFGDEDDEDGGER